MIELVNKILGDPNERKLRKLEPLLDHINHHERDFEKLSDQELRAKTDFFKNELANRERSEDKKRDYELEQEVLEFLLPEAFAVVREAGKRTLGMRHYDVQMLGGTVLHNGGIAEMRTGEGKTLVATLPAYLNALSGKGVHVVTVNDYLASRDAEWMGQIYNFLGLSVGTLLSNHGPNMFAEKKQAYGCDITYGTNNEYGFDYLRDNMAGSLHQLSQRPYNYAIIDEVDSILIDEARTPLIISGRLAQSAEIYQMMSKMAPKLKKEDHYTVDEKARNVILTEDGIDRAQEILNVEDIYDPKTNFAHYINQALRAKELFQRDIDYVVNNGNIVIVDEFTGRMMEGRRWSDGLHQAIEAKENVKIQDETQTLASITFQNLFRLYPKLSGMTGTAKTEEAEFGKIYDLEVTVMPTNRKDVREDKPDVIYKNEKVKFYKLVEDIIDNHEKGRPVLVGTTSIETSEWLAQLLTLPAELTTYLRSRAKQLHDRYENNGDQDKLTEFSALLKSPEAQTTEAFEKAADKDGLSFEESELLKSMGGIVKSINAVRKGIPHKVLNAKHHEQEAAIVAQAGRLGAITIATNMAGRGTDIVLGGNPEALAKDKLTEEGIDYRHLSDERFKDAVDEQKLITDKEKEKVLELGGLYIIGTERHESRRIDNQLRGRAARQGDPGATRFYLSLEDNLLRIFHGQKISALMETLNVDENFPITAGLLTKAVEHAQSKVEAYHFEIRKNLLKYDDVLTEQRKLIYEQRRRVLEGLNLKDSISHMIEVEMERCVTNYFTPDMEPVDREPELIEDMLTHLHAKVPQLGDIDKDFINKHNYNQLIDELVNRGLEVYDKMESELTRVSGELEKDHGLQLQGIDDEFEEAEFSKLSAEEQATNKHPMRRIERDILLSIIDQKWIAYLQNLDSLRDGIGLRAYGQKDPLNEYKREAFEMFQRMTYEVQRETVSLLFRAKIQIQLEGAQEAEISETALTEALETAQYSEPDAVLQAPGMDPEDVPPSERA